MAMMYAGDAEAGLRHCKRALEANPRFPANNWFMIIWRSGISFEKITEPPSNGLGAPMKSTATFHGVCCS